jgi:DNA-directed RNA polymerase subunit RPC12/RpoP
MNACPHCGQRISVPRLFWKGPLSYTCSACGKKSRLSNGQLALSVAPTVFVVLPYYLTIFLILPRYDTVWLLGSVIVIAFSLNFLSALLVVRYGRFIPIEPTASPLTKAP